MGVFVGFAFYKTKQNREYSHFSSLCSMH